MECLVNSNTASSTNNGIAKHPEQNSAEYLGFDPRGLTTSMKDPRGKTSAMSYNPLGWKLTEANALTHTTTYDCCPQGRLPAHSQDISHQT